MNKLYVIYDKVKEEPNAVFMATNKKDCIRQLVFCKYFNVNRLEDTKIIETTLNVEELDGEEIDIKKVLEELSMNMENEAKKNEGGETEIKEKIKKEVKDGGLDETIN